MKKKSVSVIMSVMMLFSAISFAGCQQDETALLRAQVDGLQAKLDEKIETIEELKTLIEKQRSIKKFWMTFMNGRRAENFIPWNWRMKEAGLRKKIF